MEAGSEVLRDFTGEADPDLRAGQTRCPGVAFLFASVWYRACLL